MSTKIKGLDNAVITCESIMQKVASIDSQVADLEGQREHNASCGNWTVVNAIKDQIKRLNRDKALLGKILEDAEER